MLKLNINYFQQTAANIAYFVSVNNMSKVLGSEAILSNENVAVMPSPDGSTRPVLPSYHKQRVPSQQPPVR